MGNAYLLWTKRKQEMCNKISHDESWGSDYVPYNGTCAEHDPSVDGWNAGCSCVKCGKILVDSSDWLADPRPGEEPAASWTRVLIGWPPYKGSCSVHDPSEDGMTDILQCQCGVEVGGDTITAEPAPEPEYSSRPGATRCVNCGADVSATFCAICGVVERDACPECGY